MSPAGRLLPFESCAVKGVMHTICFCSTGKFDYSVRIMHESSAMVVQVRIAHAGPVTFTQGLTAMFGGSTVASASAVLQFQRQLGTAAVTAGTVLGAVQFTGWDSVVHATGAQIRSVFTVRCQVYTALP